MELLHTEDGETLESVVNLPTNVLRAVVIATHPHPLYGGDMSNPVPTSLAQALPESGIGVIRFNFRGVGHSTGSHGNGESERLDVAAAVDDITSRQLNVPIYLAGYSFGADVALSVAHPGIDGWIAVAAPLSVFETFAAGDDPRPKSLLVPSNDQFRSPEDARLMTADWSNTDVHDLDGADHFLAGYGNQIVNHVVAFIDSQLS